MRKLAWFAGGYAAALLAARYLLPETLWPWAAGAAAALALAALLLRGGARLRALISLAAAAVGFLWTWGYHALFVAPCDALAGEERTITLRISDYPKQYGDYSRVEAVAAQEGFPSARLLVYDYDGGMAELRPGDLAEMPLRLLSARTYYGAESDYYLSSGIRLRGYLTGSYTVTGRWGFSWLYLPKELSRVIQTQALAVFTADVAPLMKALLTGEREELYADDSLYSAMKTAGFVHIVAVSGMHVAFLVGLLRLLTGRRRLTALLGVPLVLLFMAMVGFTPSVTRAGVMQILLLLAPLLRREADMPTCLAAALLALLLPDPAAVGSLSLQYSFAAMAGLLLVSPRVYDGLTRDGKGRWRLPRGVFGKLLAWVCAAFSSSVGALLFTTPISALASGFVPVYGILTNLLCLWVMSAAFCCGYPVCLLGLIWAQGAAALGWAVGWLPRWAAFVVRTVAGWPLAALSVRHNLGAWWLVFAYAVFLLPWLFKGKERFRPVLPTCAALSTLALLSVLLRPELDGKLAVSAVDVGQGSCTVALTDSAAVVIDCGSTGSPDNAGDRAADFLLQNGRSRVDLLILTHFHADHANGVRRLMGRVPVRRLAIAADYDENDYAEGILADCARAGTEVYTVAEDRVFRLDNLALTVYAPLGVGDPNEECLLIYGDYGDFEFLVTGDAGGEVERLLTVLHDLGDMELLVAGHHGSRTSTSPALLDDITPEAAMISAGAGNAYGHPAPEVLERLAERGIQVYRTDLDGTVTLTVDGGGW